MKSTDFDTFLTVMSPFTTSSRYGAGHDWQDEFEVLAAVNFLEGGDKPIGGGISHIETYEITIRRSPKTQAIRGHWRFRNADSSTIYKIFMTKSRRKNGLMTFICREERNA